jgi:hypothetical protein
MYKDCLLDTHLPKENRYDEWLNPEHKKKFEETLKSKKSKPKKKK